MVILKFLKQKTWIVAVLIFLLAFVLRLVAAFKLAWRPDEIVYVDWIGNWFTGHFFSYFFQFFHRTYPVNSDIFGNPPLAMWAMSIGIWVAKTFGFKLLLGARLVNVILGSLSAVLIFKIGKKWFNFQTGLGSALAFSLLPIVVANNGSAYLETLLILLILISFEMYLRIIHSRKKRDFILLGISLGLAVLTKFVAVPIVILYFILIPLFSLKARPFWKYYIIFLVLTIILPFALWAGLRDPAHISGMISLYKNKLYSPYPTTYLFPIFRYYYLMLIGITPPIIVLPALAMVVLIVRNIIKDSWKKYSKEISLLSIVVVYLAYNSVFTGYGGSHQLLAVIPFILILAALGWDWLLGLIKNVYQKYLVIAVSIICLILPLSAFRPELWSQYASSFVGGPNEAYKLYTVGIGGEGVPEIADWINQNTPENSRTAIVAYDWLLNKYLNNRTATSLFLQEGLAGAMSRGADYIVLPRQYMEGAIGKTAQELSNLEPVYSYTEKGILMANIYKVDYSVIRTGQTIEIAKTGDWELQRRNSTVSKEIVDKTLIVKYDFPNTFADTDPDDNRFIIASLEEFSLADSKGIYFEAYGDGNRKPLAIYLVSGNESAFSYSTTYDWQGWKKIYIPFDLFYYESSNPGDSGPNLKINYKISFMVLSKTPIKGEVQVKNIAPAAISQ
jgi:4-amino-4-deoxy-L-arabinose transferase-like glycosyltransferase